jgi:rSAM/selenodomain-associated transferase 2
MPAMPAISIIVPIRDEPAELGEVLSRWWSPGQAEMLVVDDTGSPAAEVLRRAGARVIERAGSRGARLGHAAGLARGDILFFLHADSRPPDDALELVRRSLSGRTCAGAFSLEYAEADRTMRCIAWSANLRSRWLRLPFGDQGLFCTRAAYESAGGFRDLPVCDDLDLVRRLKRTGRFEILPERVVTSARHYRRRGVARQTLRVWRVLAGYYLGVDPTRLARWYHGPRDHRAA